MVVAISYMDGSKWFGKRRGLPEWAWGRGRSFCSSWRVGKGEGQAHEYTQTQSDYILMYLTQIC
jgi:hypothetical protein